MSIYIFKRKRSPFWHMRVKASASGGVLKVEKSTKMKDYGRAERLAEQVEKRLDAQWESMQLGIPLANDDPHWKISEALRFVVKERWSRNKNGDKSARQVERCIKLIGDIPIRSVDADVAKALRNRLEQWPKGLDEEGHIEYLAPATVDRHMRAMSTLMTTLRNESTAYKDLFVPKFKILNKPNARERLLSPNEEARLLALCKNGHPHYHDLFVVLLDTGMRVGEALKMTYEKHIPDRDCGIIRLSKDITKTSIPRSLPVSDRAKAILQRRRVSSPYQPFHSDDIKSGTRVAQVFGIYRRMLGVTDKDFVPHMLRHTCCTRLFEKGVEFFTVQSWMGHSVAEMTKRYAHLTVKHLESATAAINSGNAKNSNENARQLREMLKAI